MRSVLLVGISGSKWRIEGFDALPRSRSFASTALDRAWTCRTEFHTSRFSRPRQLQPKGESDSRSLRSRDCLLPLAPDTLTLWTLARMTRSVFAEYVGQLRIQPSVLSLTSFLGSGLSTMKAMVALVLVE